MRAWKAPLTIEDIDLDEPRPREVRVRLKLDETISARIPLEEIRGAFERMKAGEVARSVVMPGGA